MGLVKYALAGNFKRFNSKLKEIAKEENRSLLSLQMHFLKCFRMLGCGYSDYLNYELYRRSDEELKEYISIKDQDRFYEIVSPSKYKDEFSIKPNFLRMFKKYINRDYFDGGSREDLEKFIKKHEAFMLKPTNGLGGHEVEKVYSKDVKDIDELYKKVTEGDYFLDECVKQNREINRICDSSVNTIRVMTFGYKDYSEIVYAEMRFGNGSASVDNFHQGGMGVRVNLETGKLEGDALSKNLDRYSHHPKSGIKFDGFQIPKWDEISKTCLEAAKVSEHIHFVGWDVAVTDDGVTFIEGNRRAGWDLTQVLEDRGCKDMMRHCLDKLNEMEGTNYHL